jgi:hypothetical protein
MAVANQIFHAKILLVNQTGAVNVGDAVNVGRFFNVLDLGGSAPIGDFAVNAEAGFNFLFDPDLIDQSGGI